MRIVFKSAPSFFCFFLNEESPPLKKYNACNGLYLAPSVVNWCVKVLCRATSCVRSPCATGPFHANHFRVGGCNFASFRLLDDFSFLFWCFLCTALTVERQATRRIKAILRQCMVPSKRVHVACAFSLVFRGLTLLCPNGKMCTTKIFCLFFTRKIYICFNFLSSFREDGSLIGVEMLSLGTIWGETPPSLPPLASTGM